MNLRVEEKLLLYRQCLRIRLVEEAIAERYVEGEMRCPVHLSIGQEGIAVAVCGNLEQSDYVVSNHRCHAHYLAKGGDLNAMIAEIHGKATGCAKGIGGSMHLIDLAAGVQGCTPIVGSAIPLGVGVAFGVALKGETRVTALFFGDAAIEEGVFHESMNFASLSKLRVLFVCENNLYSVYTHLDSRQPSRELTRMAQAHEMEHHHLDGNDVESSYFRLNDIVASMRLEARPIFVQLDTYRWREHCGPHYDNHLGYRSEEEFLSWKDRDPIDRMVRELKQSGIPDSFFSGLEREFMKEIDAAFAFAQTSPFPHKGQLGRHVYK